MIFEYMILNHELFERLKANKAALIAHKTLKRLVRQYVDEYMPGGGEEVFDRLLASARRLVQEYSERNMFTTDTEDTD